jgi:hypothetical protein
MIKKVTKAAQVRSYVASNPKAKPAEVAKAIGVGLQYVYTVLWNAKKKAGVKKKTTLTLPKPKWGNTHITSSNVSIKEKLKEYEAKKTQEEVDKYWQAVNKVQAVGQQIAEGITQIDLFEPEFDDLVNHPAHYKIGGIETIDFIEAKKLNYNIGNVVKYLTRADHKGNKLEDLRKAQWYLTREISTLK